MVGRRQPHETKDSENSSFQGSDTIIDIFKGLEECQDDG